MDSFDKFKIRVICDWINQPETDDFDFSALYKFGANLDNIADEIISFLSNSMSDNFYIEMKEYGMQSAFNVDIFDDENDMRKFIRDNIRNISDFVEKNKEKYSHKHYLREFL